MILELDCGNSLIKWRIINRAGERQLAGVASDPEMLIEAVSATALRAGRLVSVRSDAETQALLNQLENALDISIAVARSAEQVGLVVNGYEDYQRLGLDRWLAILAGYQRAQSACLILDLGTAVTSDFVSAKGEHLGGFICPGIELMRGQLQQHTRRIRYQVQGGEALSYQTPGRNTADAVERGCLLMLQSFARSQIELGREWLGEDFNIYLTGGDAGLVIEQLPQATWVSELVFEGLALACPIH